MTIVIQLAYEYWPVLAFIVTALVVFLAWLTWRAHLQKVTTGYEGMVGKQGEYVGNNLVQVNGELWKTESGEELTPGDLVIVTEANELKIKVVKRK